MAHFHGRQPVLAGGGVPVRSRPATAGTYMSPTRRSQFQQQKLETLSNTQSGKNLLNTGAGEGSKKLISTNGFLELSPTDNERDYEPDFVLDGVMVCGPTTTTSKGMLKANYKEHAKIPKHPPFNNFLVFIMDTEGEFFLFILLDFVELLLSCSCLIGPAAA